MVNSRDVAPCVHLTSNGGASSGGASLSFWIALSICHKHTDALGLLRACRERPTGRRAAKQRDELAPSH